MAAADSLITTLEELGVAESKGVQDWVGQLGSVDRVVFLIEACRALDYQHVLQFLSKDPKREMPRPSFEIMMSGWNRLLGLCLPGVAGVQGFPLMESTQDSLSAAMTALHQLGGAQLMWKTAAMIRHGMMLGERAGDRIVLRRSERTSIDHFLDQLDIYKLEELSGESEERDPIREILETTQIEDIDKKISTLVFPWKTDRGTMVGYGADPDVDRYFMALVLRNAEAWRNEAGIHPEAKIGNVLGRDITMVGLLLTSLYLKHIRFAYVGHRIFPEVNLPMSLTIWKREAEKIDSLADFTGIDRSVVSAALNLFTVRPAHSAYFLSEPTPCIPMLIEVSKDYLLCPVSGAFKNPFHGVRMIDEWLSGGPSASVVGAREDWMRRELYYLFLGDRYQLVNHSTRLRRGRTAVTDIDAAVFDWTTGEVALFQLKWQDFNQTDVGVQRSKAKNFVTRVDRWGKDVGEWITEFGWEALCRALRLNSEASRRMSAVRLFAIGQSASRFRSYGCVPECESVAVCSWPQFVRLRYEIGPADNVFRSLHAGIVGESVRSVQLKPIPHEVVVAGQKILFENVWNAHGEEGELE